MEGWPAVVSRRTSWTRTAPHPTSVPTAANNGPQIRARQKAPEGASAGEEGQRQGGEQAGVTWSRHVSAEDESGTGSRLQGERPAALHTTARRLQSPAQPGPWGPAQPHPGSACLSSQGLPPSASRSASLLALLSSDRHSGSKRALGGRARGTVCGSLDSRSPHCMAMAATEGSPASKPPPGAVMAHPQYCP